MCVCVCVCARARVCARIYVCVCVCVRARTRVCVFVWLVCCLKLQRTDFRGKYCSCMFVLFTVFGGNSIRVRLLYFMLFHHIWPIAWYSRGAEKLENNFSPEYGQTKTRIARRKEEGRSRKDVAGFPGSAIGNNLRSTRTALALFPGASSGRPAEKQGRIRVSHSKCFGVSSD